MRMVRGKHAVRTRRLKSRIARIAGMGVLLTGGVAGVTVGVESVTAGSASAQCIGVGAPAVGGLYPDNVNILVWDTPLDGCNNDGTGLAAVSAAPGWTPVLWIQDGNPGNPFNPWAPWTQWYGAQTVSWFAANGEAREFYCAVNDSNNSAWCGVGNEAIFLPTYTSYVWEMNVPVELTQGF